MYDFEESPHLNTCTHRMDGCELIKEAEQVAVLLNARGDRVHYSLRVKDWYSCQTVAVKTYEKWQKEPALELKYLNERMNDLRVIQGNPE